MINDDDATHVTVLDGLSRSSEEEKGEGCT